MVRIEKKLENNNCAGGTECFGDGKRKKND